MEEIEKQLKILNYKLTLALTYTIITEDGHVAEIRQLVTRIDNLKLEIYPNEHPPPHFHVISNDFNVSINIENCEIIKGQLDSKTYKKVKYFFDSNKKDLIAMWNHLRPSNCPVGLILTE
jgi:hypothetical protein